MDPKSVIPGRIAVALRNFPPFSMMPLREVERLAEQAEVIVMAQGDYVWKQGDPPPHAALFLARGRVEYIWKQDGHEELVDVRDVGDILGLTALIDAEAFRVSARVVEYSLFYSMAWSSLREALDRHEEARNYARRHLFWATRVGRSASIPHSSASKADSSVLQAHLQGAQRIQPRSQERLVASSPLDPIGEVAARMVERNIPSMLIVDEDRHPIGILTHANTVQSVVIGKLSKDSPVREAMSSPVVTIAPNTNSTEALLLMMRKKISQLCITEDGTVNSPALDVCSHKDLLAQSGNHPAGLLKEVQQARNPKRLRWVCDELELISQSYLKAGISAIFLGKICAEIYDALTQRLIKQAMEELASEGFQVPQTPWVWLSVGSDGRREQILRTDMDNAIAFRSLGSDQADEAARHAFCKIAERAIDKLVECGFSRCQGGVMALNPAWCQSDKNWLAEIENYHAHCSPESILRALIVFDMRAIGEDQDGLLKGIRYAIFEKVSKDASFQARLAQEAIATPPPLNFLGKLVVEKKGTHEGRFDIKGKGLSPLRDAIRLMALKEGIDQRYSTGGRLEFLSKKEEYRELAGLALESYDFMLRLRTATGLQRGDSGRYIECDQFTKVERAQLSNCFDVVRMAQSKLAIQHSIDPRSR